MAELEDILNASAADVRMDMGLGDQGDADEGNAPQHNPAWARLLAAWEGEKACPELLKWRGDLVDGLLDALEQQERMVAETVRGGADVDEYEAARHRMKPFDDASSTRVERQPLAFTSSKFDQNWSRCGQYDIRLTRFEGGRGTSRGASARVEEWTAPTRVAASP